MPVNRNCQAKSCIDSKRLFHHSHGTSQCSVSLTSALSHSGTGYYLILELYRIVRFAWFCHFLISLALSRVCISYFSVTLDIASSVSHLCLSSNLFSISSTFFLLLHQPLCFPFSLLPLLLPFLVPSLFPLLVLLVLFFFFLSLSFSRSAPSFLFSFFPFHISPEFSSSFPLLLFGFAHSAPSGCVLSPVGSSSWPLGTSP